MVRTAITRRMTFSSGHRLYNPGFSDEKNREVFGDCSNPNGHGHNYVLEVTVSGSVAEDSGMVINLKDLKRIVAREIIDKVDHRNLNVDVDFMKDLIPTTENFAQKIWEILDRSLGKGLLDRIVLYESENNWVEIRR
ncbi:MAG: 6-carboxytetrahydropterin synthase [Candidatus Zixiibacteriota bacterium]|nr:MAG: 6-carboxytetrahydropterin synthase [candidate division Zixibacteria bacterium]